MDPRQLLHPDRIAVPAAGERAIQLNEDAAETDGPVAVVDIGSNSIRLAIIETDGHDFLDVLEEARAVPKLIRDVNRWAHSRWLRCRRRSRTRGSLRKTSTG